MQSDDDDARKMAQRRLVVEKRRKTLGSVMSVAIRDSDYSQAQVAKKVGMTEDMMSDIVNGLRKTELAEIELICEAINENPLKLIRRVLEY